MSKRERRNTTRLTYDEPKEEKGAVVGSGTPLGEIDEIKLGVTKKNEEAIKALHQLVFKSKGKHGQQGRNLKAFAGFVYGNEPEIERQRFLDRALKLNATVVKDIMDVLGIERAPKSFEESGATKEAMCERLIEFLECPKKPGKKKTVEKKKATPATPKKSDDVTTLLMRAVAKRQLENDSSDDPAVKDLVKAAEEYVGCKLPKAFSTIMKDIISNGEGPRDEEDEEEPEEPPAKKPKKSRKKKEEEVQQEDDDDDDDDEQAAAAADGDEDKMDEDAKDDDQEEEEEDHQEEQAADEEEEEEEEEAAPAAKDEDDDAAKEDD